MNQQTFIQNLIDNQETVFEEYYNCKHRDIPLPDWQKEQQVHQDWRALPLWWMHKPCKPVQKSMPVTTKLLETGPGHRATAWVRLLPQSKTPAHRHLDWGNKIILHLPLEVPNGDVGFCVDGSIHRWKVGELFAFNSSQEHYGFNNTDEIRIMLVMEFDETWEQTLRPYMTVTP